jgi:hypothetical protein
LNSLKTDEPALTAAMFLMALAVERRRERRNPNFVSADAANAAIAAAGAT